MKRIVICCDGTWNKPDENQEGVPCPTNVTKLAQALLPQDSQGVEQLLFYDVGVGTSGSFWKRLFDGATGTGISQNILEAYRFLIREYQPGDTLYFFGFSRGAFTVRSLAGLIRNCGILKPPFADMVNAAYALYRSRAHAGHPREKESVLFRKTYAVEEITPVHFIGVWDTVGSLGNPLLLGGLVSRKNQFHDTELSTTIAFAYQALAIDEKRHNFKAALWNQQGQAKNQTLEQVWFAGVHCNIGGGYANAGLSDLALDWMASKAAACGLALGPMAPPPQPNPLAPREESWKSFYRLFPPWFRPMDEPGPKKGPTNETLHPSVLVRFSTVPAYRPRNLLLYLKNHPAPPVAPILPPQPPLPPPPPPSPKA
jgi:uncharacterized protein (DUF2235 family)